MSETTPQITTTTSRSEQSLLRRAAIRAAVAVAFLGGGILTLVLTSFDNAAVYSRGVDALVKEKQKLTGRNVRVEGALVKGSLKRRLDPCEYRFSLSKNGVSVPVHYSQCVVPDTFKDMPGMDVMVTAEGTLAQSGDFEATTIFAKCPSKYEMKDRASRGEQAPHAGMPAAFAN